MIKLKKRSSILTWIAIFILILSLSGGIFTLYVTQTISNDAEMINKLGIIRGSIQRLVKLEMAGVESEKMIADIDTQIDSFLNDKIRMDGEEKTVYRTITGLKNTWNSLKTAVNKFRAEPSTANRQILLQVSEAVWDKANTMVFSSQIVSEKKLKQYRISYFFTFIHLILGILIIFLIQRYVKKRLEYLVDHDGLTDLHNKRYFNECLRREISKGERYQSPFSLILFDIDHFKKVNDVYGHDIGDVVLKELSRLLAKNIRKSDIHARIGGEEFAIITTLTKGKAAYELAEKFRKLVEGKSFEKVGTITISLGITEYKNGDSRDSIFKRADNALYAAKNQGRNQCIQG